MPMREQVSVTDATLELLRHLRDKLTQEQWVEVAEAASRVGAGQVGSFSLARYGNYDGYLASPEWTTKRAAALQRARNNCEYPGCVNTAQDVHHLGYEAEWGEEPLHHLVALCKHHHSMAHDVSGQYAIKWAMLRSQQ